MKNLYLALHLFLHYQLHIADSSREVALLLAVWARGEGRAEAGAVVAEAEATVGQRPGQQTQQTGQVEWEEAAWIGMEHFRESGIKQPIQVGEFGDFALAISVAVFRYVHFESLETVGLNQDLRMLITCSARMSLKK